MFEIVKPQSFVMIVLLVWFDDMIGRNTIIVTSESEIRAFL